MIWQRVLALKKKIHCVCSEFNTLHCCWLQISTQKISLVNVKGKKRSKQRKTFAQRRKWVFWKWIKTSLVLVFYFHCISMYCLSCHKHSSHSLFIDKKTICKMTTLYTETIFKMTSSFGNNLRIGRTNDFPLWHTPSHCHL